MAERPGPRAPLGVLPVFCCYMERAFDSAPHCRIQPLLWSESPELEWPSGAGVVGRQGLVRAVLAQVLGCTRRASPSMPISMPSPLHHGESGRREEGLALCL